MTTLINMIDHFKNNLKRIVLYAFFINFSVSWAGSYEDFFQATQRDQVQVVSNLLSRGFDPNTVNVNAEPAIFDAWDHGALKVLESLIRHPNTKLNVKNSHGESLLMLVCLKGNLKFSQLLIERQADINHPGWTPLHYAATNGNTKIVKMLLDESAYIDAESPNGTTPLMMAARYGTTEAVKLLIDEGADIHVKNQLGLTVLNFAKDGGRPDTIRLVETALAQAAAAPAKR
jgi:ankyrin repeat protein